MNCLRNDDDDEDDDDDDDDDLYGQCTYNILLTCVSASM